MLRELMARVPRSDIVQAGAAIGIAGLGRVLLNSLVGISLGPEDLARYATAISAIMLWAGLAAAGPSAAVTLGVARRWGESPGVLPRGLLRDLAVLFAAFVVCGVIAGLLTLKADHRPSVTLWITAVIAVAAYQATKAFGYAAQEAGAITVSELAGALVPLASAAALVWWRPSGVDDGLVLAFLLGPVAFLFVFAWRIRGRLFIRAEPVSPAERRLALRASGLFFVGAGSSMALQYAPVLIASQLSAPTAAALLFGALQAATVLLLLPRVYGTVMMPRFAADRTDGQLARHVTVIRMIFLPSLLLGLGVAPWIVLSLGFAPTANSVTITALVASLVLMQLWSTPAVTVLSSRGREWVPALSSLAGLAVAGGVWAIAVRREAVILLPIGLVVGGALRSLVPLWIFHGRPMWPRGRSALVAVGWAIVIVAALTWTARLGPSAALTGGAMLLLMGTLMIVRLIRQTGIQNANPARQ